MKIYRVGGSVRDELLGLPVTDHDYVVVGESPESMIAAGYQPVGRDFPVFLHPETHDEYALARTERKHGRGHQGFVFHADSAVTLEADLERRDLTINAMARDERDGLVDPYGGRRDLAARTLRHVSPAFAEDPLRVLRVARFAARFGFAVADETEALMRAIVARGELADLSPERIWREFSLGLTGRTPSMMLSVLRRCGALHEVAPELDKLYAASAPGPQPDLGVVTALSLDRGAQSASRALAVQFGIAARHLSIAQAQSLSTRLRVGNDCRDAAIHAARLADMFERATTLNADEWLTLLSGVDATRRPERLMVLAAVIAACSPTQGGVGEQVAGLAREALLALSAVDYGAVKSVDASAVESGAVDAGPAGRVRALRLRALSGWLAYRHDPVAAGR